MASPYKMKNSMLKMAAKGAPMQKNYAGSPLAKHTGDKIDLSKKSKEELAAIAKRNIEAAKKKANSSIYIDGSSSESDSLDIQKTFINNSDYGGLATDSINAVKKELKIRKNK